jgi:hypothetical protein
MVRRDLKVSRLEVTGSPSKEGFYGAGLVSFKRHAKRFGDEKVTKDDGRSAIGKEIIRDNNSTRAVDKIAATTAIFTSGKRAIDRLIAIAASETFLAPGGDESAKEL